MPGGLRKTMTVAKRVLGNLQRPFCALMALVLLGLGCRSTVSCLGSLFGQTGGSDSTTESMRVGPRDRLPKPTRQQYSTSMACLREIRLRQERKPLDPFDWRARLSDLRIAPLAGRSAPEIFVDGATDPWYLRPHEAVAQSPLSPPV